jgi:hypothetical protein
MNELIACLCVYNSGMKTIKIHKTLALKTGEVVPAGTLIQFVKPIDTMKANWLVGGVEKTLRYTSVIKTPSQDTIAKWCENDTCKSVFGTRTEMDGTGEHGEPSWALCLGLC